MTTRHAPPASSRLRVDATPGLTRRSWLLGTGAVVGSGLFGTLAACGGGDDDPIWGGRGAATEIVKSLRSLSQSSFPAVDFPVTDYGAQTCDTVAFTSPYTDPAKSPFSAGSDPSSVTALPACRTTGAESFRRNGW